MMPIACNHEVVLSQFAGKRSFDVLVIDNNNERTRYTAIARGRAQAMRDALNLLVSVPRLVMVKPC